MSLIQILTKDEEKIFELPPSLDSFAKNHFFKLTSGISEIILEMKLLPKNLKYIKLWMRLMMSYDELMQEIPIDLQEFFSFMISILIVLKL